MTDDPTAASDPARIPDALDDDGDYSDHGGSQDADADDAGEGPSSRTQQDAPRSRSRGARTGRRSASKMRKVRRAKAGVAKKLEFMTHLMSNLDIAIVAEMCILYYMDCSFLGLFLRSIVQAIYLTSKSEEMSKLLPPPRPNMICVYGVNLFCILMHLLVAPPQAGEADRGYLHGGIIIDFVGQKAPTSRFSLLLVDGVIFAMQCINCAVWLEKEQVKNLEFTLKRASAGDVPKGANDATSVVSAAAALGILTDAIPSGQDLDSEERGVIRNDPLDADGTTEDIEMQPLVAGRERTSGVDESGRGIMEARYQRIVRTAGGSDSTDGPSRPSLLDILMSGNGLLANLHVPDALRILMADTVNSPSAAGYPIRLTGYGTRIAQLAVERARQQRA